MREFFFFLNNFLQNDLSHSIQYRSANPLVERVYDLKPVLLDRRVSRDSSLLCNLVMQTIQLSLFFSLVMERNDRVSLCGSDGRMKKKTSSKWILNWRLNKERTRWRNYFDPFHNYYENFRVISHRRAKFCKESTINRSVRFAHNRRPTYGSWTSVQQLSRPTWPRTC